MASNRPDPGEFFDLAQRMLRELLGESGSDEEPWAAATRRPRERSESPQGNRELSAERQRENLTFALAARASTRSAVAAGPATRLQANRVPTTRFATTPARTGRRHGTLPSLAPAPLT